MTDGDTTASGVPWTASFDPVANVRALADVQLRSARAAGELIERLVRRVDGATAAAAGATNSSPPPLGPAMGPEQLVELWSQVATSMVQAVLQLAGGAPATAPPGGAVFDLASAAAPPTVHLRGSAPTALWLHNSTAADVAGVRLRCTELIDHAGHTIKRSAVAFAPATIDVLPGRSSREVTVTARLTKAQAPGTYRGAVLAEGAPDAWLPLELVVEAP